MSLSWEICLIVLATLDIANTCILILFWFGSLRNYVFYYHNHDIITYQYIWYHYFTRQICCFSPKCDSTIKRFIYICCFVIYLFLSTLIVCLVGLTLSLPFVILLFVFILYLFTGEFGQIIVFNFKWIQVGNSVPNKSSTIQGTENQLATNINPEKIIVDSARFYSEEEPVVTEQNVDSENMIVDIKEEEPQQVLPEPIINE